MKLRLLQVLAVVGCLVISVQGRTWAENEPSGKSTDLIRMFSQCVAYWDWLADYSRENRKPAESEYLHSYSTGARISALWLLSVQYKIDNPDAPAQKLSVFNSTVEGIASTEMLRLEALAEGGDEEALSEASQRCVTATKAAEVIIEDLRKQQVPAT